MWLQNIKIVFCIGVKLNNQTGSVFHLNKCPLPSSTYQKMSQNADGSDHHHINLFISQYTRVQSGFTVLAHLQRCFLWHKGGATVWE